MIGSRAHAKLSVTVQFTIYLSWRARRMHTCMHACMPANRRASERASEYTSERANAITQCSWVDALCSFPCVHYIFRPLRLQGYARNAAFLVNCDFSAAIAALPGRPTDRPTEDPALLEISRRTANIAARSLSPRVWWSCDLAGTINHAIEQSESLRRI